MSDFDLSILGISSSNPNDEEVPRLSDDSEIDPDLADRVRSILANSPFNDSPASPATEPGQTPGVGDDATSPAVSDGVEVSDIIRASAETDEAPTLPVDAEPSLPPDGLGAEGDSEPSPSSP